MAVGLASLEVVLEEGNRKDWFSSPKISQLAVVSFAFLSVFLGIELTRRRPFINLKLLLRRNFGIGSFAWLTLRLGLYGAIYILPLYLVRIQNWTTNYDCAFNFNCYWRY